MLHLRNVPTSNTLDVVVKLLREHTIVATLAPNQKAVMHVAFDSILPDVAGVPPLLYRQQRGDAIDVDHEHVASLERVADGVALQYARRHAPQNTVLFSASSGVGPHKALPA
ncbi:hypothetical protein [Xanthomonas sp. 3058]|uniref:hypothetical protein n=1 Tax=Xanthomonas sp. 3058 TaxID=3035314 RepID=UPI00160936A7|nr:hypothetical protein [Xanthomonas sp. 3058]MBB5864017.1 cysteine synthase [Xanthomonas sp. 3058]